MGNPSLARNILAGAAFVLAGFGAPVFAQDMRFDAEKLEAGLSFGTMTISGDGQTEHTSSLAILRLGYELGTVITLEGEIAVALDGETIGGRDYESRYQGLFLRADYPIAEGAALMHARIGGINTEGTRDDWGLAVGLGASMAIQDRLQLRGDATLADLDVGRAGLLSLGLTMEF